MNRLLTIAILFLAFSQALGATTHAVFVHPDCPFRKGSIQPAIPSVFRHQSIVDDFITLSSMSNRELNEREHDPLILALQERVFNGLPKLQLIAKLFQKNAFHIFAERGAKDAVGYTFVYTMRNLIGTDGSFPSFYDPLQEDLAGLPPSVYALQNGHLDTYELFTEIERDLVGPIDAEHITATKIFDKHSFEETKEPLRSSLRAIFAYYAKIDESGSGKNPDGSPNKALQEMFDMFSDNIIYARNWEDVYKGKEEFKAFYLYKRDIIGAHSDVQIKMIHPLDGHLYIAVEGMFNGVIGKTNQPVKARFYDHFLLDRENIIVRRMSDIDTNI